MSDLKIKEKIYGMTESEKWHLEHPGKLSPFYNKMKRVKYKGIYCYLFDFINTLQEKNIGIVRETRFTTIPVHYHKDMELSYVYDGTCTFEINGRKLELRKGDVCIIDTDVIHSAEYKEKTDIVYNVVFRKSFFSANFLSKFSDTGVLGTFLLNTITGNQATDNYLVFHTDINEKFKMVFDLLLSEYYYPSAVSTGIIEHYFSIMLLEMVNSLSDHKGYHELNEDQRNTFIILKYIEENCAKCSLNDAADQFHFSVSYLYKLLKRMTGRSFSQLKLAQQLKEAEFLLLNTSLPVLEVSERIGIKNPTFFYKKFKEVYGVTPKEYKG